MAWLSAVPEENKPKGKAERKRPMSRGETFKEGNYTPPFPDVGEYGILINYLGELGVCNQGMSGPVALAPRDITGWLELTGLQLMPELGMMLVRLSRQYVATLSKSTGANRSAPYTPKGEKDLAKTYLNIKSILNNG